MKEGEEESKSARGRKAAEVEKQLHGLQERVRKGVVGEGYENVTVQKTFGHMKKKQ